MKFRTAYSDHIRFKSDPGSRYRKNYVKKIDSNSELEESGIEDVYDSIQKAAQGICIEDLIRRARNGDATAIREPIDSYADLTHAPSDMLEAHQMLVDARSKYNSLPRDLRAKFGNNFDDFLKATADGSISKMLQASAFPSVKPLTSEEINKIRSSVLGGKSDA